MGRHGENIRYRKGEHRWEARVVISRPGEGGTRYKSLYGATYAEAKRKKQAFLAALPSPGAEPAPGKNTRATFSQAASLWLEEKRETVKESTYAQYSALVRLHLLPQLGDLPLDTMTGTWLGGFLARQKRQGRTGGGAPLADKTVRDLRGVLVQVLRLACRQGMISAVPDCPGVPCRSAAPDVLTRQDQKTLTEQVLREGTPFGLGVLLSLYASLRIGEACGVRWEDVDFANGTLRVERTVMRIANVSGEGPERTRVVVGRPKTDCSLRTVPLPQAVTAYLARFRRPGNCYLMTGTGKFMEPRVCRKRFARLLGRAGLPHYSYHALRHTYATRCVESGVDLKSLSEMMGHSDVKITLQRYVHPSLDTKREQVQKLPTLGFGWSREGSPSPKTPL